MAAAHKLPPDQETLGEGLHRIQGRAKQLSARVHAQTERATHEFDALRAELESVQETLREAQQQVNSSRGKKAYKCAFQTRVACMYACQSLMTMPLSTTQVREIKADAGQRAQMQMKLQECEQILRTGPGGDIRSYLQRKKRALILAMLLGDKVPLKAGACSRWMPWQLTHSYTRLACARYLQCQYLCCRLPPRGFEDQAGVPSFQEQNCASDAAVCFSAGVRNVARCIIRREGNQGAPRNVFCFQWRPPALLLPHHHGQRAGTPLCCCLLILCCSLLLCRQTFHGCV